MKRIIGGTLLCSALGLGLASCGGGGSSAAPPAPSTTATTVPTLQGVVSALKGSNLKVCNVDDEPGGAAGINATAAVYLTLNDCSNVVSGVGAESIFVYAFADPNAAYAGAGFNYNPASGATFTLGDLAVEGQSLTSYDAAILRDVMSDLGAQPYQGGS